MDSSSGLGTVVAVAALFLVTGALGGVFLSKQYFYRQGLKASSDEAYQAGFEKGNRTGYTAGYNDGFTDGKEAQPYIVSLNPGERVDEVGAFQVNGFDIDFRRESQDERLDERIGYTWFNGSLVIKSGMSIRRTFVTCRHEIVHNRFPEKEHTVPYNPGNWGDTMKDNEFFREREHEVGPESTCLTVLSMVQTSK